MRKLIKEPLIHFLVIGAGLFLLYSVNNNTASKNEIIIDQFVVNDLSEKWDMQWHRQPTSNELKKLVELYINQEVLYREALAMNLDHNDEIIKRRLAKKMEFISDELAETLQPSEEILERYYRTNKSDYSKPPVYSFTQVFFDSKNRKSASSDASAALTNNNPIALGDALSLPNKYENVDGLKVAIDFGTRFAQALDTLQLSKWLGPIRSGYGIHIVFIENKESAGVYGYDEVKEKVNADYNFFASNDFQKELTKTLLKNYDVIFELENSPLKEELVDY